MIEQWRELLYPIGYLSGIAFGVRFFWQWIASEVHKKSHVPRIFWHISLTGNVLLMVHSFIQIQYHVCITQACIMTIAWRHLNLLHEQDKRVKFTTVLLLMAALIFTITGLFWAQSLLTENYSWFQTPASKWTFSNQVSVSTEWHMLGFVALGLFSMRYWVQWLINEKQQVSTLGAPFWWLSLLGNVLCLLYFIRIGDPVNYLGPICGVVPYIRNLMLLNKTKTAVSP